MGSRKIELKGSNFDGTAGDKDKVFFLSAREYRTYNKSVTGAKNIPTDKEWLLRTPSAEKSSAVATVHSSGKINLTGTKNKKALRPAINIDPSKFPGVIGSGTAKNPYAFCDQATVDRMAADEVKEIIRKLPDKNKEDKLTDKEKEEIERAVGAYNSLTKDQKKLIDADTLKKLKTLKGLSIGVLYEDETVYKSLYLENKPNIVLEDVTIFGDLTIKYARCVKMKNVTLVNGDIKIYGRDEDRKTLLTMDNVTSPQGCYLRRVASDAIDNLKISSGQFHLYQSTVKKFRRSSVNGGGSDKAMLMEHTYITLMENCEIRSDKTAIHILTSPGFLRTDDSIETLRHSYI